MRARRPLARAAALVLLLAAAPLAARAADAPDPAALEAQVRDWLAGLLGPDVALGERPVRLLADGDHLALTVPVAGTIGPSGIALEGPPFTARLRRLEGGRWALEDGRLPSPLRVTAPGGQDWTVTFADQTQRAVLDPTLATASTWDGRAGRYATASHGPGGARTTEATNLQTHVVWQPSGAGRVDVRETASSDLIASNAHLPHAGVASFSAGHSEMSAHIDGLSPGHVAPVLQAVLRLAPLLGQGAAEGAAEASAGGTAGMTPAVRQALGGLLSVAGDLLGGAGERTRFDRVHVHAQGLDLALRRLEVGGSLAAPDGRLLARLDVVAEGLESGALPPGPMRQYLPHRLVLRQSLGGLPAADVLSLLRAAVQDAAPPDLTAQGMALLLQGPLAIGLEEFATDLGPASLTASGTLRVAGPGAVTGQADIRATGLDALIAAARTEPMLRQALPALIFLKGIGEPEGAATLWAVAYQDGRLTVNGTDLSQMMPGK